MITKHNDADALAVNLIGLCHALRGRCYTWAYERDQWFKSRFGKMGVRTAMCGKITRQSRRNLRPAVRLGHTEPSLGRTRKA
jgi:hypothetical protein